MWIQTYYNNKIDEEDYSSISNQLNILFKTPGLFWDHINLSLNSSYAHISPCKAKELEFNDFIGRKLLNLKIVDVKIFESIHSLELMKISDKLKNEMRNRSQERYLVLEKFGEDILYNENHKVATKLRRFRSIIENEFSFKDDSEFKEIIEREYKKLEASFSKNNCDHKAFYEFLSLVFAKFFILKK